MSTLGIVSQPGRSRKDRFERISDRAGAPGRFNGRSRVTGLDKGVRPIDWTRCPSIGRCLPLKFVLYRDRRLSGRADPGQAGFAPSSARGEPTAPLPDPLGGAGPPASAQPPAPGGSGFEAAAVLQPTAFVQVLRPDLVDHDLVSAGTGGVLPPQAPGRGTRVGGKPCDALGDLAGDTAVQLAPARVPLVVVEREE